ncbi:hypothetical protein ACFQOZ_15710 [Comamonas endophytica]|uniref:hypothetical protein n=1 Tax=Comamonas endophytica TaxID=2949090 RepID=UPI00361E16F4
MNYSISPPGSPQSSIPLLPQEPVVDKADEPMPASRPAQGGLQGALVAVGNGSLSKALYRDAESVGDEDDDDDDNDVFEDAREAPDDAVRYRSEPGGIAHHDEGEERYDAALANSAPLSLDAAEDLHAVAGPSDEPAHFAVDEDAAQERLANETRLQQQNQGLWQKIKNWFSFELPLPGDLLHENALLGEDAPPAAVQPVAISAPRDSAADVEPQIKGTWKRQLAYAVGSAFNQAQLLVGGVPAQPQLVAPKNRAAAEF